MRAFLPRWLALLFVAIVLIAFAFIPIAWLRLSLLGSVVFFLIVVATMIYNSWSGGILVEDEPAAANIAEEAVARLAVGFGPEDVCVLIPAYNEEKNLPHVLKQAPAHVKTVVIDDGSSDQTANVAQKHGAIVLRNPVNMGGGQALRIGYLFCRKANPGYVVTLDADGQHQFSDLNAVLDPVMNGGCDISLGSRFLGSTSDRQRVRTLGIKAFNLLSRILTGVRASDTTNCYRAFSIETLRKLKLFEKKHHTAEFIVEGARRGLSFIEVPIHIEPRLSGDSKKGPTWKYGFTYAQTLFGSWWRK